MTRIDFYQLSDTAPQAPLLVSCKLVKRALKEHPQIYLQVADQRMGETLDDLLWSFDPDAFIPHVLLPRDHAGQANVCIGVGVPPSHHADVLINLSDELPPSFQHFRRVCELVPASEEHRARARERFRYYKERGYPLHYHQLGLDK